MNSRVWDKKTKRRYFIRITSRAPMHTIQPRIQPIIRDSIDDVSLFMGRVVAYSNEKIADKRIECMR